MQICTHVFLDCCTLSLVPGHLRMVCQASKRVGEGFLHFQFELNTLGPWMSTQIKNLKDWIRFTCELYLQTFCECVFFHSCLWGTHYWNFKILYLHPVYSSLNASHYLSHPHKTASHIILLFFSVFTSLDSGMQTKIYNLKRSRHTPKSFSSKFVSC
jgi:hypothetical protein